jgi:acyl-CoA synthetase (AMP-forming)/AMP-acid ligase II
MTLPLIRRALDVFPPTVQFVNGFGQTETASTVTALAPDDHRLGGSSEELELKIKRLGSVGRPLPDVEIRIMGENGQPLGPDTVGELAIRSKRTMRGYFGRPEATADVLRDGWLLTRDLAWCDEGGYVFLAGRKSDVMIRGGENVAPAEVELTLAAFPGIEEAAVVGVPDEEWGERIVAFVVLADGTADVDERRVLDYCRPRLAAHKRPDQVVFTLELPRNELGKVIRQSLRERVVHGL